MAGSSEQIAKLFLPGGAFLALGEDAAPAGQYTSSQIRYLVGDLLRFTSTVTFEYVKYNRKKNQDKARAVVRWEYTRNSDSQPREHKLNLILVVKDEKWVIQSLATTG